MQYDIPPAIVFQVPVTHIYYCQILYQGGVYSSEVKASSVTECFKFLETQNPGCKVVLCRLIK